MTWREQMVARILLMVARIFADDRELSQEIKHLMNSIQVEAPKERTREEAVPTVRLAGE